MASFSCLGMSVREPFQSPGTTGPSFVRSRDPGSKRKFWNWKISKIDLRLALRNKKHMCTPYASLILQYALLMQINTTSSNFKQVLTFHCGNRAGKNIVLSVKCGQTPAAKCENKTPEIISLFCFHAFASMFVLRKL